ncbi:MAG: type IV conjugative transfer system coupling protein TraD [Pseudomonadota bacterium]
MKYPIENLLRRPVELFSAGTSAMSAAWLLVTAAHQTDDALLTLPIAITAAAALTLHATWRAFQGFRLLRYQRRLRRPPYYALAADEIPVSRNYLFLGRGFEWEPKHTQRLMALRLTEQAYRLRPSKWHDLGRNIERYAERTYRRELRKLIQLDTLWNPFRPMPPVGGIPALHAVGLWEGETDIFTPLANRVGHVVVIGTTRVGKSRLLEVFVTQDIHRAENVIIVFDPKGDAGLLRRIVAEAKRSGRERDLYIFHLGFPEFSARYNPVGDFERITEIASRIAGQLPDEGNSRAFKEFVWRFVNVIVKTLVSLGVKPSFRTIYQHAINVDPLLIDYFSAMLDRRPDCANWREEIANMKIDAKDLDRAQKARMFDAVKLTEYVRRNRIQDDIANALAAVLNNEKSYFEKLVSSLFPLMEKLCTGRAADLISPDYSDTSDTRPVFTWDQVINQGGIVYIGLDALTDREVATAIGTAMLADLTSIAGKLYNRGQGYGQPAPGGTKSIVLHLDEFNELIIEEMVQILNKAGGAGYEVTAYTQTWADVEARIGDRAKAKKILGNLNALIMMRVQDEETAAIFTDRVDEVKTSFVTPSSRASDTNDPTDFADFASQNEDRIQFESVPLISAPDLVKLPKGQAFALLDGNRPFKLRLPLPDASHDPALPLDIEGVTRAMRRTYVDKYLALLPNAPSAWDDCDFGNEPWDDESTVIIQGSSNGF